MKNIGEPDLKLDWKNKPWLHILYNKFFFKNASRIDDFVSIIKEKELGSKADFDFGVRKKMRHSHREEKTNSIL